MKSGMACAKWYGGRIALLLVMVAAGATAASAACANILVVGAGNPTVNGTYAAGGESYGHTVYTSSTCRIVWQGTWLLQAASGDPTYYYAADAAELPFTGWESNSGYAPAPTLSCADTPPAPPEPRPAPREPRPAAPRIVGSSYTLEDQILTLVYRNIGNATATVDHLLAGPGLCAEGADGNLSFLSPNSDLREILPLDQAYAVAPDESLTLVIPLPQVPAEWFAEAALRSALFTAFTFGPPHLAIAADRASAAWIHILPAWLEAIETW